MTVSPYQVANRILLLGIALVWMIAQTSQTLAHDSWINRGGYRNPAGEWCTMLNHNVSRGAALVWSSSRRSWPARTQLSSKTPHGTSSDPLLRSPISIVELHPRCGAVQHHATRTYQGDPETRG